MHEAVRIWLNGIEGIWHLVAPIVGAVALYRIFAGGRKR